MGLPAVFVAVSAAYSADAPDLKVVLQTRYAAMKAAMATHDGQAIAAILSPRFTSTDTAGHTETAAQMIAEINALKADPNKTSETTLLSVVPDGMSARVQQRYDMKTVRTSADGAEHKVELETLSTDNWVKPADTWLMDSTVTDEMSYFSDGHLVAHKARQ